jgi:hypothetical protein
MRRRLTVLVLATLGVVVTSASPAVGAANPDRATCHALYVSTATHPGDLGPTMSDNARTDRPFGQIVVVGFAQSREPCPD